MTTLRIKYALSDAARRRIAISTGEELPREQALPVDLVTLTPEQRTALLAAGRRFGDSIDLQRVESKSYPDAGDHYTSLAELDDVLPSVDAVLAYLGTLVAQRRAADAEQRQLRAEANAKITEAGRAYLALSEDTNQPGLLIGSTRAWEGVDGYEAAREMLERAQGEYARRQELARERAAADKAAREAARADERAARLAWAREHGSERLRRGLEAGYDYARLYVAERAAAEYPGYVVDYNDVARWSARSAPSLAALDERDAVLAAHPGLDPDTVEIVWLTHPASDRTPDESRDDEDDDDDQAYEAEAVAIRSFLGKYDLVKEI